MFVKDHGESDTYVVKFSEKELCRIEQELTLDLLHNKYVDKCLQEEFEEISP